MLKRREQLPLAHLPMLDILNELRAHVRYLGAMATVDSVRIAVVLEEALQRCLVVAHVSVGRRDHDGAFTDHDISREERAFYRKHVDEMVVGVARRIERYHRDVANLQPLALAQFDIMRDARVRVDVDIITATESFRAIAVRFSGAIEMLALATPEHARHPLPGHPTRPIYEPAGQGDSYFPTVVYDGAALAYGHQQSGTQVWPTMQPALALDALGGVLPYPVSNNRRSDGATPYTGVVVQYAGDGVYDPHALYSQLDAVKFQYSCFADTFVRTGTAQVLDPAARRANSPCN